MGMSMFNFSSDVSAQPADNEFDEYSNVTDEDYTKATEPDFGDDA